MYHVADFLRSLASENGIVLRIDSSTIIPFCKILFPECSDREELPLTSIFRAGRRGLVGLVNWFGYQLISWFGVVDLSRVAG